MEKGVDPNPMMKKLIVDSVKPTMKNPGDERKIRGGHKNPLNRKFMGKWEA
jgi:hypothetical protein